ncbi:MAG TPA: aminotransferase class V-fold PLP-dependent enzyme, partial [Dongiaceae bacterium]|nr:aminotransferase class V-fold PLP-dependent enzyme [Dongiaceae bacterium]
MTTPIPTSDGVTGLLPGAAGLPDENTLSQLASLFFSALPGTAPDIPRSPADAALIPNRHTAGRGQDLGLNLDKGVVPAVPATSQTPAPSSAFSSQPRHSASLQPLPVDAGGTDAAAATQAATQAPQPPTHASTQLAPEVPGSPLLYAAALPQVGGLSDGARGLPGSVPTSPFYFLSEANAQRTPAAPIPLPAENRVTPQAFGLPGERELAALLGAVDSKPPAGGVPSAGRGAPGFYFLDAVPTRESGGIPQEPHPAFDVNAVRRDFAILSERVNGRQLIWLDNAATTHKPQAVIDRLAWFYAHENSNIHRAAHELAARATDAYEG